MFKRIIITSGPTVEPIDPVRYISNRSSGKSGYHLANEGIKRFCSPGTETEKNVEIIYITGPTCYIPEHVTVIRVETALEMRDELAKYSSGAEVIIMAAAVSDYRMASVAPQKIKKGQDHLTLELIKNPDLLTELGQRKPVGQILVGYAAETDHIFENARRKFEQKNLDILVLNEISEMNPAFNADDNQVYFVTSLLDDGIRKLERMEKSVLAAAIWDEIISLKRAMVS